VDLLLGTVRDTEDAATVTHDRLLLVCYSLLGLRTQVKEADGSVEAATAFAEAFLLSQEHQVLLRCLWLLDTRQELSAQEAEVCARAAASSSPPVRQEWCRDMALSLLLHGHPKPAMGLMHGTANPTTVFHFRLHVTVLLENGCVAEALAMQRAAAPPGPNAKAELLRFVFDWFLRWSGGELSKMGRLLHLPLEPWEQQELRIWLAESPKLASLLLLFLIQSNRPVEAVQALRRFEQVRHARACVVVSF
jgi:hypothetical protein